MCGLFGWYLSRQAMKVLGPSGRAVMALSLATEMEDRGTDSWGFYDPLTRQLFKAASPASAGYDMLSGRRAVMAHTRQATSGKVTRNNAHPFRIGAVVGAHNGVIHNEGELDKKRGFKAVDSMHIVAALAAERDKVSALVAECEGSAALTWCGVDSPTWSLAGVYICRASESSSLSAARLCIGKRCVGIVWASTQRALERVLDRVWTRRRGTYGMVRLDHGEVVRGDENGWWTVPDAPEVKVGEFNWHWTRSGTYYSGVQNDSRLVVRDFRASSGCRDITSMETELADLEEEYLETGDAAVAIKAAEVEAAIDRRRSIEQTWADFRESRNGSTGWDS